MTLGMVEPSPQHQGQSNPICRNFRERPNHPSHRPTTTKVVPQRQPKTTIVINHPKVFWRQRKCVVVRPTSKRGVTTRHVFWDGRTIPRPSFDHLEVVAKPLLYLYYYQRLTNNSNFSKQVNLKILIFFYYLNQFLLLLKQKTQ